jgi:hypothetical protein
MNTKTIMDWMSNKETELHMDFIDEVRRAISEDGDPLDASYAMSNLPKGTVTKLFGPDAETKMDRWIAVSHANIELARLDELEGDIENAEDSGAYLDAIEQDKVETYQHMTTRVWSGGTSVQREQAAEAFMNAVWDKHQIMLVRHVVGNETRVVMDQWPDGLDFHDDVISALKRRARMID